MKQKESEGEIQRLREEKAEQKQLLLDHSKDLVAQEEQNSALFQLTERSLKLE